MSISESILVAIFCLAVVFSILALLWGVIRIFSSVIQYIEHTGKKDSSHNKS